MDKLKHLAVRDLMTTSVISVRPGTTVHEAQEEMHVADIRHLPVVDERQRLVGILSDRDLLRAAGRRTVAEIMTRDVVSVTPDTPARTAAAEMLGNKIGALPVLGEDFELVGLVTETDFLRIALHALGGAS